MMWCGLCAEFDHFQRQFQRVWERNVNGVYWRREMECSVLHVTLVSLHSNEWFTTLSCLSIIITGIITTQSFTWRPSSDKLLCIRWNHSDFSLNFADGMYVIIVLQGMMFYRTANNLFQESDHILVWKVKCFSPLLFLMHFDLKVFQNFFSMGECIPSAFD